MAKEELITFEGIVTEVLPDAKFRVELENGHEVIAYTAGKMRKFRIKTIAGDRVTVEMSPYDLDKGRLRVPPQRTTAARSAPAPRRLAPGRSPPPLTRPAPTTHARGRSPGGPPPTGVCVGVSRREGGPRRPAQTDPRPSVLRSQMEPPPSGAPGRRHGRDPIRLEAQHPVVEHQHLPGAAVGQERTQGVELVPAAEMVDQPFSRILERPEDVVEVDDDARPQARQDLEELVLDVAAGLQDVARIDEQHVVRLERVVQREGNLLDRLRQQGCHFPRVGKRAEQVEVGIGLDQGSARRARARSAAGSRPCTGTRSRFRSRRCGGDGNAGSWPAARGRPGPRRLRWRAG